MEEHANIYKASLNFVTTTFEGLHRKCLPLQLNKQTQNRAAFLQKLTIGRET